MRHGLHNPSLLTQAPLAVEGGYSPMTGGILEPVDAIARTPSFAARSQPRRWHVRVLRPKVIDIVRQRAGGPTAKINSPFFETGPIMRECRPVWLHGALR
jgi:hypothetical protein